MLKQGGDTNTIAVVDGMEARLRGSSTSRSSSWPMSCSISRVYVKNADRDPAARRRVGLLHDGADDPGLSRQLPRDRRRMSVDSAVGAGDVPALSLGGGTINTMMLGGLALVFSRVIDNSVVVLEKSSATWRIGRIAGWPPRKAGRKWRCRPGRDPDHGRRLLSRSHFCTA